MQEDLIKKGVKYLANTYSQFPIVVTKGEGCWLWDMDGRRYLDLLSGIAVCNLGHAHKDVVQALSAQASKLFHVSNLFYTEPGIKAAELLVESTFGDKVFFCNSGAEANEAAIKLARRYSWKKYGEGRHEIIAMENSFHGRTIATLSATGQQRFQVGFGPMLEGFHHVPFNDIEAVTNAITEKTCAVMLEPIQAEGGVYAADKDYMTALRAITSERDLLLILDEVQTGMGRTGRLFAHEHYDIKPDIMCCAKALANGFPMGAIIGNDKAMGAFEPGTHAATFGGNPLATAALIATLNTLLGEGVVKHCEKMGIYLSERLSAMKKEFPFIVEIRGKGLLIGIELSINGDEVLKDFLKEGILLNCTKGKILRLLPPLIIEKEEADIFLETARRIFEKWAQQGDRQG